jgi:Site-specific recombinases, DNA invertase Pin homologs
VTLLDTIYARQSIDKKDSISIESQIDLCRRECGDEPRIFADKGYSGKNTDRPDFIKLMRAVEADEVDKIVVYRLDRISRSITDFGRIWETLKEHGVEFVSVNEKFDTSAPMGRAMIYIIMVFAQLERETIAERIKDNYHQRAKRGAYLGGPAPYGFEIKRTSIDGKAASMLVPNNKIEIVKEIFSLYAGGDLSLGGLCKYLHDKNIPGITRAGWDNVSLARILHNPVYVRANADVYYYYKQKRVIIYNDISEFKGEKACWLFGKRDRSQNKYTNMEEHLLDIAFHNGVVYADTWLKCQYKLDHNRQIKNSGRGSYTWLSGLIKCGYCGYSMRVNFSNGGRYVYFTCTGKSNLKLCSAKFDNPHVSAVEPVVSHEIKRRLLELKSIGIDNSTAESNELNGLKIELGTIENQISNLIDSLANSNEVAFRYINERMIKLDERKTAILNEMKSMLVQHEDIPFPETDFDTLCFEDKKRLARILIKKVFLANEEIKIQWVDF